MGLCSTDFIQNFSDSSFRSSITSYTTCDKFTNGSWSTAIQYSHKQSYPLMNKEVSTVKAVVRDKVKV